MRVVNRRADLLEERDLCAQLESAGVRVIRDGNAFHEFHHEVWNAVVRASIEEARDIRMLERGEYLALVAEALLQQAWIAPPRRNLQRDGLVVFIVVARRLEYDSHSAAANLAHDSIGSGAAPRPIHSDDGGFRGAIHRARNTIGRPPVRCEQGREFAAQLGIFRSFPVDECLQEIRWQFHRLSEQLFQPLPAPGVLIHCLH